MTPATRRVGGRSGFFPGGVDQPATRAGDAVGQGEDHQFAHSKANEKAAKNVIKGNLRQQAHHRVSNHRVPLSSQPIGAEP